MIVATLFFKENTKKAKTNSEISSWKEILSGVPHGSICS